MGFLVSLLLLLADSLTLLFYVVKQVVQHLQSLDCAEVLLVVHYIFEVKHFDLSRWRKPYFLVKIAWKAVLDLVGLLALQLNLLGEFILLVNQNIDVLPHTWFETVVLVYLAHIKMETHKLDNALLAKQVLGHEVALHHGLAWQHL